MKAITSKESDCVETRDSQLLMDKNGIQKTVTVPNNHSVESEKVLRKSGWNYSL